MLVIGTLEFSTEFHDDSGTSELVLTIEPTLELDGTQFMFTPLGASKKKPSPSLSKVK